MAKRTKRFLKGLQALLKHKFLMMIFGLGAFLSALGAFVTATMVEATSSPEFCNSCHEMDVFYETWDEAAHGSAHHGVRAATCVDCHLPPAEDGVANYLFAKSGSGTKDIYNHLIGHTPDWAAHRALREEYTYEAGCRKCHVELVAPEIPLKARLAHRDYMTGETSETCISCHFAAAHGDLLYALQSRENQRTTSNTLLVERK